MTSCNQGNAFLYVLLSLYLQCSGIFLTYSPSFIPDLPSQVNQNLRNIIDLVFLPGFNNPTLAVLFQTQTWTGYVTYLSDFKSNFTLRYQPVERIQGYGETRHLHARYRRHYPVLTFIANLPHDSMYLLPCSTSLGVVVIVTSNALIYVDQSSRRVVLPVIGWTSRISDIPTLPSDPNRKLILEGSRSVFVDEKTFFLVLKDGTVYPVEITLDGKIVSNMTMSPPLAQTSVPSIVKNIGDDHIFIGSTVGPSVLLKAARVEEEVEENELMDFPTAVIQEDTTMDYDDEDEGLHLLLLATQLLIALKTYMILRPSPTLLRPRTERQISRLPQKRSEQSFICL